MALQGQLETMIIMEIATGMTIAQTTVRRKGLDQLQGGQPSRRERQLLEEPPPPRLDRQRELPRQEELQPAHIDRPLQLL